MTPVVAWEDGAGTARRALLAAGERLGRPGQLARDEASLRALLAGPPGALLVLEPEPVVHDALAAGWIVVTCAKHLDARHGRDLLWVATRRAEVLARALVDAATLDLAPMRRAARQVAGATSREAFALRFAPPRVSVIVTARDEPRVAQAIESVLAQSFASLELVVVDDGSRDDTRARALAASQSISRDPRVTTAWRSWGGPAAARNLGLRLARGEAYVAFLDADDLWAPLCLERLVEALDVAPSSVALAHCDVRLELEGEAQARTLTLGDVTFEALARSAGLFSTGSYLVRRAVARAAPPFDEELLRGEDHAWLLGVLARAGAVRVPEVLLTVRRSPRGQLATGPLDPARLSRAAERAIEHASAGRSASARVRS